MILLTLSHCPSHTLVLSDEARECSQCHTMAHFFINRFGRSTCLTCDTNTTILTERSTAGDKNDGNGEPGVGLKLTNTLLMCDELESLSKTLKVAWL